MNMTIKSKKTGTTFSFTAPEGGGYIRLGDEQICKEGHFYGATLTCVSEANFIRVCRSWYTSRMRILSKES